MSHPDPLADYDNMEEDDIEFDEDDGEEDYGYSDEPSDEYFREFMEEEDWYD